VNLVPILAAAAVASTPPPTPNLVEGRVMLKCTLHADGSVDPCEVERESPEGMGFGERALELAKRARYNRAQGTGVVRIPMIFPVIDMSETPDPPAAPPPR
jgi:TonB family protein